MWSKRNELQRRDGRRLCGHHRAAAGLRRRGKTYHSGEQTWLEQRTAVASCSWLVVRCVGGRRYKEETMFNRSGIHGGRERINKRCKQQAPFS